MNHLHVDADDLWIYEEEYGETRAPGAASVYDDALPRLLDLFDEANVVATIFVIGKDLERASARELCRDAVVRGHEVANHSYTHPGRLSSMSRSEKEREIRSTHDAIAEATGVPPVGFRAPGYYLDRDIVEILSAHGYLYDTSILPTFLLPLMKLYLDVLSRRRLDKALGIPRGAVASRGLRRLRSETENPLYELPVSVLPWLRLPVHSTFAFQLPPVVRRAAYRSVAAARDPVFLFHAIDGTDYPGRDGLSGRVLPLRLPLERRLALVREALECFPASATSRATLAARDPTSAPVSHLLPHV